MFYDSNQRGPEAGLPFNPFKALVAPRPIGWISTLDANGGVNLAPYSYFQAVADSPDVVMFSATPGMVRDDGKVRFTDTRKDSQTLAEACGEFVCNIVSYELAEAMNLTSAHLPHGQSEAEYAQLELAASTHVQPPRVALAPAAIECVTIGSQPVHHRGGAHRYHMVFGEVVGIHIDDKFVENGRVNTAAMQVLTRMGYDEYAVLERSFSMTRPDYDPILSPNPQN